MKSENIMPCEIFSCKQERDLFISGVMLYPDGPDDKIYRYVLHATLWLLGESSVNHEEMTEIANKRFDAGRAEIFSRVVKAVGGWHNTWSYLSNRQQKNPSDEIDARIKNAFCALCVFKYAVHNGVSRQESVKTFCETYQEAVSFNNDTHSNTNPISKYNEDNINSNIWNSFKGSVHMWAALTHFYPFSAIGNFKSIDFDRLVPRGNVATDDPFRLFLEIAERYRQLGISFRPPHSDDPLLSPYTTWVIIP